MPVATILIRTSLFFGGSTWISSIFNFSPGAQQTAARHETTFPWDMLTLPLPNPNWRVERDTRLLWVRTSFFSLYHLTKLWWSVQRWMEKKSVSYKVSNGKTYLMNNPMKGWRESFVEIIEFDLLNRDNDDHHNLCFGLGLFLTDAIDIFIVIMLSDHVSALKVSFNFLYSLSNITLFTNDKSLSGSSVSPWDSFYQSS